MKINLKVIDYLFNTMLGRGLIPDPIRTGVQPLSEHCFLCQSFPQSS